MKSDDTRTETFNTRYLKRTPNNRLNFIGVVEKYFNVFTKNCSSDTQDTYIRDYNERIFPHIAPGIPICDYNDALIDSILGVIKSKNAYDESTIQSRYLHLITDPIDAYYNDPSNSQKELSPLWGSAKKITGSDQEIASVLLSTPKSFFLSDEKAAFEALSDPYTYDGLRPGLMTSISTGVRNNESAGFNFGDLIEMSNYPGYYYLRVVRTSEYESNRRKAGGKTSNAPRNLPLIKRYVDFLKARMEFILSKINFPYTDIRGKRFESINDLPIACRRDDFTNPCSAPELTTAGRMFFKDEINIREQDMSGIAYMIEHNIETAEKDPTTYLFRRNFATHLHTLGFPIEWSQYYMGHLIEDDILKRWDFNDEGCLYQMAKLLENHPFNNIESKSSSNRIIVKKHAFITIENRELNDPIHIKILGKNTNVKITSIKSNHPTATEIDVTQMIKEDVKKEK